MLAFAWCAMFAAQAAAGSETSGESRETAAAARVAADRSAGKPLVAHAVVVLADNATQGIVPVKAFLGDGTDPASNLYWGARYGVRTFLERDAGWTRLRSGAAPPAGVLERVVYSKVLGDGSRVFLIADAWDGTKMRDALEAHSRLVAGHDAEVVRVELGRRRIELAAGGAAHVIAYLGHNGLMEVKLGETPGEREGAPPRSAIVLACISDSYFEASLERAGAHRLLMTRGLMAPEAYTLDAALSAWFGGRSAAAVKNSAAASYCRYQRCSEKAGRALFVSH